MKRESLTFPSRVRDSGATNPISAMLRPSQQIKPCLSETKNLACLASRLDNKRVSESLQPLKIKRSRRKKRPPNMMEAVAASFRPPPPAHLTT